MPTTTSKSGLSDLRQRFEGFAARFAERHRAQEAPRPGTAPPHALEEDYWKTVQELFTRDLTQKSLREFLQQETRDTLQFFTRDVDFTHLRNRPWYQRYPLAAWKVFLTTAYRLSPPRRLLFAVAVPLLLLSWLNYLRYGSVGAWFSSPAFSWTLVSATLLFVLLVLELKDKLTLKGDLEVARQIQFGLLPFEPFERDGTSIRVSMRPANTVGGDYFDIIELGESRIAVVMGDVAGKGMPAALLMALLQGSLRTLLTAGLRGPELIATLNAHLFVNIPSNRLVTLFYGELDPCAGALRYINAGHNPPYVSRASATVERLTASGMALGVVGDSAYEARELTLGEGDRLVLYTDGLTEAFDAREEEYGEERLAAFLIRRPGHSPAALIEGLQADVLAFCGSARPRDDMTMMVVGRGEMVEPPPVPPLPPALPLPRWE